MKELEAFMNMDLKSPYWILRKAVVCFAFFGALRIQELCELKLENIISHPSEDIRVKHSRAKQRSDKKDTLFLIPRSLHNGINYANFVDEYLNAIKDQHSKVIGRAFW